MALVKVVVVVVAVVVCVLAFSSAMANARPGDDRNVYITCGEINPNPGGAYQDAREKAISKLLQETVRRNYAMYYRKVSTEGTCYAFARCRMDIPPNDCQQCLEMLDEEITENCVRDRYAAEGHYQECDMKYDKNPFDAY